MEVRLLDQETIETVGAGYVTGAVLARARAAMKQAAGVRRIRYWVADAAAVTGFSGDVRIEGSALLSDFRALGGTEIVAALPSPAVRMIVVAVAFAAGLPVKVFAAHDECLRHHHARTRS